MNDENITTNITSNSNISTTFNKETQLPDNGSLTDLVEDIKKTVESDEKKECSDLLQTLNDDSLLFLYEYISKSFSNTYERGKALSEKGSRIIGLITILCVLYANVKPDFSSLSNIKQMTLIVGMGCFVLALFFYLISIRIHKVGIPPNSTKVIDWTLDRLSSINRKTIISNLIVDYAVSESKYWLLCEKKARYLRICENLVLIGAFIICAHIVLCSKLTIF